MFLNLGMPSIPLLFGLTAVVGVAVWTDTKSFRIPNLVTLSGVVLALSLHTWSAGMDGLTASLAGLAIGFCGLFPLYILGGMAAGDIKLMGAVGSFLGPVVTLLAVLFTLICGGLLAVWVLLFRRKDHTDPPREQQTEYDDDLESNGDTSLQEPKPRQFAYAPSIALGTLATLCWIAL